MDFILGMIGAYLAIGATWSLWVNFGWGSPEFRWRSLHWHGYGFVLCALAWPAGPRPGWKQAE